MVFAHTRITLQIEDRPIYFVPTEMIRTKKGGDSPMEEKEAQVINADSQTTVKTTDNGKNADMDPIDYMALLMEQEHR